MRTADQTLLRLADPTARAALLASDDLLEITRASYEIDPATVVGDATAVFETVDLCVAINPTVAAEIRWSRPGVAVADDATMIVRGLVPPTAGADAVWRGSIVLRVARGSGEITEVSTNDAGRQGDGDEAIEVGVTFSAPTAATPATPPTVLPIVVAFLVADDDVSPREMLLRSEAARRAASRYRPGPVPADAPARTRETSVCWVVPASQFDDDGWPGASGASASQKRSQRLNAARDWLRTQGVAVVAT